jgi:dUTP pyrophosphatase
MSTDDHYTFPKPEVNREYFGTLMSTALEEIEVVLSVPTASEPTRKHEFDAGIDLMSCEDKHIPSNTYAVVDTGIIVDIPEGYVGYVKAKSKSNFIVMAGVVDAGYLGTIKVKIFAIDDEYLYIGSAIGQLVIQKVELPKVKVVEKIEKETERGSSGGINQYKVANLNSKIESIE